MTLRLPTLGRLKQVNPCGGCTACCSELGVKDLGKPPRCRCEHETHSGCGIYGKHPAECQRFVCAWAMGAFGSSEKYRPDQCGLLFTVNNVGERPLSVFLLTPDADQERMKYLLARLREKYPGHPVTLIHPHGISVGADFECRPPYPLELSSRLNVFTVNLKDPNTRVCEGPAAPPPKGSD